MDPGTNDTTSSVATTSSTPAVSNSKILCCSLGLALFAGLLLPLDIGKKYKANISITATGIKDETAKGVQVWVRESYGPGLVAVARAEGWVGDETVQASYGVQPATIHWEGLITPDYQLNFVRHPESGRMILTINGISHNYSLYSDKTIAPLEIRPYDLMVNPKPVYSAGLLRAIITLLGLLAIIYFVLRESIRWNFRERVSPKFGVSQLLMLSVPSIIIYTIALLAFWPGQMTSDSLSHWIDSETRSFNDAHSAFLGMSLWLVTRFWHSPTVVPVLQILGLTWATVLILGKLRQSGVPAYVCILAAIIIPIYPANFLMVTTFWKDVPYTIALLFTFWLLISLVDTKGQSATSKPWKIAFVISLAIVTFTRHNGPLVSFIIPIICGVLYKRSASRFFFRSALGLIISYIVVKLILYPALNVPSNGKHYRSLNAMHLIGAFVAKGTPFNDQDRSLIETVYPIERWKSLYMCQSADPLFFGDAVGTPDYDALGDKSFKFIKLALKKSFESPAVFWKHQKCVTSVVWRILPFQGEQLSIPPQTVAQFPFAQKYGLVAATKLPIIHTLLVRLTKWTLQESHSWLFWRPGLWLILSIISTVALVLGMRDIRYLLTLAPSFLNTLSLIPAIGSPDYRYQWVVTVIGMFLVPLALSRKVKRAADTSHSGWKKLWYASEHLSGRESVVRSKISFILPTPVLDKPRIAVVVPCYRVRGHVLDLLSRIGPECSFIYCVDDKCPEDSGSYIQEHTKDPRVRVLFHEFNQGVGGAVLSGYSAAIREGATVLVKIDGDGQMDPALLPAIVAPIIEGSADYTIGNRFFNLEGVRRKPALRLFRNAVLSFLTKVSSGYWSTFDPTNGYTAIHATVAKSLPFPKIDKRFFFESDMLFRLNVLRARVVEIPMVAVYRDEKRSMVISLIAGEFLWKHARNLMKRIGYNYFLRDFSVASLELLLGLPMVMFGFFFGLHAWFLTLDTGVVTTAGTVMLSVLPSILGVQFLLSFISHDILRTPSEPIHRLLLRLPPYPDDFSDAAYPVQKDP